MTYCNNKNKATINYKFADKQGRYITENVPIEIQETHKEAIFSGGQCPIWYGFIYTDFQGQVRHTKDSGIGVRGPISNIELLIVPTGSAPPFDNFWVLAVSGTAGDDVGEMSPGIYGIGLHYSVYGDATFIGLEAYNPDGGEVELDNCGDPPQGRCTVKVLHEQQPIFSISGRSPCSFNVTCDEECPPDTTRCDSTNYPGYCCLPCNNTKQSIIDIKNIVKTVNKKAVSYG